MCEKNVNSSRNIRCCKGSNCSWFILFERMLTQLLPFVNKNEYILIDIDSLISYFEFYFLNCQENFLVSECGYIFDFFRRFSETGDNFRSTFAIAN